MPIAQPVGTTGWRPAIYHPQRIAEYLRFERLPLRKTKLTGTEALRYAARVLWHRERRAAEKRRKLEAIAHPRHFLQAAE